jgi:hypothetical protein
MPLASANVISQGLKPKIDFIGLIGMTEVMP